MKANEEVFRAELGTLNDTLVNIPLKGKAEPKFFKARPVPCAIKAQIEEELDRLVENGVYEPVHYSKWATPIVPVPKDDGTVRICGDYKLTVNRGAEWESYPVPKTENLIATLNGGKEFSKLDLRQAYQQLLLNNESRERLTINTHKGLFQTTRLQYGVHSAPGMFQREMEKRLSLIPYLTVRIDDILITDRNRDEHLANLQETLRIIKACGLRLKKEKCVFFAPEIEYLGYCINSEGVSPVEPKITPILNLPIPTNITQLKLFLGALNFYHRHLPNSSHVLEPLHKLLRKDTSWHWSQSQQEAFEKAKKLLCSTGLLVHYDQEKPLLLSCDASPYGIGGVLSHLMPDGTERPIAYTSRTLSPTERNYSQIEWEGLAMVYSEKKFHQYLFGRSFTLTTDHKPLLGLFGEEKPVPIVSYTYTALGLAVVYVQL